MSAEEDDKSTINFTDSAWIANSNGWLHANNVLFYFAQSDFFDHLSRNQELVDQCAGVPEREAEFLATREKMERALLDRPGLQFVVEVDPVTNPVFITGPNGQQEPSELWVIRKQELLERGNPTAIKILDYYYIYNKVIFQAPRVKSVLNYRMLQSMLSIDKIVKTASELPIFSASYGHTYLRPGQKSSTMAATSTQASRIGTPAPEAATQELATAQPNEAQSDEQTLRAALALTMDHGQTFYDDAPLVGEPGSFRFSSVRNPVQNLRAVEAAGTGSATATKTSTPAPSQAIKPASTPVSPVTAIKGNEVSSQGETKPKPKRKKSMAAVETGIVKNGIASSPASPAQRKG